jgi:hemerythrin-like domain-containing protein
MTPTELLKEEHQIILVVIGVAEREVEEIGRSGKVNGQRVDSGPIFVMLREHEENRKNVAAVAEALPKAVAGKESAVAAGRDNLAAYSNRLRAHIDKEDNVLYPMADRMFSPEDQKRLAEAFDKVEKEEMGEGVHKKYHELARELEG